VTGPQHTPVVPGVPTLAESGLPGFEVIGFFGVMAPLNTPREIVARLNAEIAKVLARSDTRERFAAQALEPGSRTAEQFGDYIKAETERWTQGIREAGITAK
jgi:tripartite-type tricarboxylate transporter receptor subunit TctC